MKLVTIENNRLFRSDVRLDAEFYLGDGAITSRLLENPSVEVLPLSKASVKMFSGKIFRRTYVKSIEFGYPYLTASDMMKPDVNSGVFLSKKYTTQKNELLLKKDWILLSCSGTLGNTIFTNEEYEGVIGTHDLIRIIPDKNKVEAGYLYAYLASKYGYSLLVQPSYGGVIKHIEPHHLQNIPVPLLKKELRQEIDDQITYAGKLREKANSLLKSAEENFIKFLNIDKAYLNVLTSPNERETALCFEIDNGTINTKTFRARNYSKRKQNIIRLLQSQAYDKLGDVLNTPPFYGGRFKRINVSKDYGAELLSQGDIFSTKPKGRIISKRTIPNIKNEYTTKGMTLIPAQGTLGENEIFGRAKFVWGYLEDKLVAGHAMRFVPNESKISAGYLHAVLSSGLWFRILRSTVYGTNLLGFITDLLVDYPIPRFDRDKEKIIDNLVKTAYEFYTEANKLENSAIDKIEQEIESWQK